MLRTDGDGHRADPAPHKTERPVAEIEREAAVPAVPPEVREDEAKSSPAPKPVTSPGSGFSSFES